MNRKIAVPVIAVAAVGVGVLLWSRRDDGPPHFTGFVEGEERVLRSEVAGRVLEVKFGEGDEIGADTPVAILDDRDIVARLESKSRERDVTSADIRAQEERVRLVQETWERGLAARRADVRAAEADFSLAEKQWKREQALVATGASTRQLMDEVDARRTEARSRLDQARETLAQTEAQGRDVEVARSMLASLGERVKLLGAQIAELEITKSKYVIRSPGVPTRVQTQYLWPGEIAQPGTAILAVLDPRDKYVQIYVPVADAANLRVGQRVEIELDGLPGKRTPGEIAFIADKASFTPEKIETRDDRLGQVYRAKVRILERIEEFRPGTEGDVYLVDDAAREPNVRAVANSGANG